MHARTKRHGSVTLYQRPAKRRKELRITQVPSGIEEAQQLGVGLTPGFFDRRAVAAVFFKKIMSLIRGT